MYRFETVIGLEIHVQLKTETKMFCGCKNDADAQEPNSNICPICLGHPGVMPVTNYTAIECALKLALALHCDIPTSSKFDRKHYFYPDLPKGYQISQYDEPLANDGFVIVRVHNKKKRIRFERLHIEEDAAKLVHLPGTNTTLVDFNRSGVPLVEMVTKPDLESPAEASAMLEELRMIVRMLKISDGDMEKGHLRCDANISLRPTPETFRELQKLSAFEHASRELWPKTEIKNMNSFKAVERALQYEIVRQEKLWKEGKPPMKQSTRGWNDEKQATVEQRVKETSEDYHYLPEPDLPRVSVTQKWVDTLQAELPELPHDRRERLDKEFKLDPKVRDIFVEQKDAGEYFEQVASEIKAWMLSQKAGDAESIGRESAALYSTAASWIVSKLFEVMHKNNLTFDQQKCSAENFAELIIMLKSAKINSTTAQNLLSQMVVTGADPSLLVEEQGLGQIENDNDLMEMCTTVIAEQPDIVELYKKGKATVLQFLIGQVMKKSKGRAKPEKVAEMFKVLLR